MLNRISDELTADEKQSAYVQHRADFIAGSISGEEYVENLQAVCGFSMFDARKDWQDCRDTESCAVYNVKCGEIVLVPTKTAFSFRRWNMVKVVSHYGSGAGFIVKFDSGLTVPYAAFQVRVK